MVDELVNVVDVSDVERVRYRLVRKIEVELGQGLLGLLFFWTIVFVGLVVAGKVL